MRTESSKTSLHFAMKWSTSMRSDGFSRMPSLRMKDCTMASCCESIGSFFCAISLLFARKCSLLLTFSTSFLSCAKMFLRRPLIFCLKLLRMSDMMLSISRTFAFWFDSSDSCAPLGSKRW